MNIRLAEENDLIALARIRGTDAASESHWLYRIAGYYNNTYSPQQAVGERVIFVAVDDHRIAGFIAGHLTRRYHCGGEIQWIDTIPEYRRRGIANALLQQLVAWFDARGAKKVCVNCDPGNTIAAAFYRRNGGSPLNEHWFIWENISEIINTDHKK
ncbi:MAG TPA: GNAT family N-acetyltransferase [Mucilaginibacter sp.]|nr:GNAT family N-acetyltransferase [Mucilaginibacter sp.]